MKPGYSFNTGYLELFIECLEIAEGGRSEITILKDDSESIDEKYYQ